ncbi:protein NRT1/ PTR FAMILY 2.10-like [Typha angustifolia]|uniref:protein NRT1/ PTR FAMILY 2.10-like n=1 Tax=Typha angustifolia TaxID=59011 RepID=UPI003C2D9648
MKRVMERGTGEVAGEKEEASEKHGNGEEEKPKINYRGWKTMPLVIGNETFEKLGSLGTGLNLMVYLTSVFHMTNVDAATTLNVFNGTTNLATVVGGFLSDSYFGRYATIGVSSVASLLGMVIMTLTAGVPSLHPPPCDQSHHQCAAATRGQIAALIAAFSFLVIGCGGVRPCSIAFGADQFDPTTESGKKGINSFFNWYYFTFTIAVGISSTIIIYIQSSVSWWLGFAIPAALMFFACLFFFMGTNLYVRVKPEGSPFTGIAQVFAAAFRKRRLELPDGAEKSLFKPPHNSSLVSQLQYTEQFRFLDKAAVIVMTDEIKPNGAAANPWRLCSTQQVEETKCVLRIIPIWVTCVMYSISFAQTTTYVVLQALQSDRHLGKTKFEIPAASFTIFPMLALTLWIPFYDRLFVPLLRKFTGKEEGVTLLQRMGVGMILSIVAMIVSAFVERRRRSYASGTAISSFSGLWLIPQLMIMGLSESFNNISQLEFYYKQFPENMRSIAGSLLFSGLAISNYLSGLLVTIVHQTTGGYKKDGWLPEDLNKGRLDYFYLLIAAIGVANFFSFIACAKWYRYKGLDDSEASESSPAPV